MGAHIRLKKKRRRHRQRRGGTRRGDGAAKHRGRACARENQREVRRSAARCVHKKRQCHSRLWLLFSITPPPPYRPSISPSRIFFDPGAYTMEYSQQQHQQQPHRQSDLCAVDIHDDGGDAMACLVDAKCSTVSTASERDSLTAKLAALARLDPPLDPALDLDIVVRRVIEAPARG
ncbi:hypothetical protein TW95_gp0210 [Pandoravirus inopinatum]|uniref:Uncharacterized protein n=1 Tax=Pandoravirus inopinatum TaxID=1605721 RepID=A0A0B5J0F1_9VIRU|nr:hypothetical protein TW95_gp0210 [Pandoravirus inopinatum]AJF96944.1 hypothetical protein [Pandoravirus inopinatum]